MTAIRPKRREGGRLCHAHPALVVALLAIAAFACPSSAVRAAELVMFEEAGCAWCRAFDREIAPAYPRTEEGRRAPLRRVDIRNAARSGVRLDKSVYVTPTFVLAENGVELGRITGYPGQDFFWGLLDELLGRLPPAPAPAARPRDAHLAPGLRPGGLLTEAAVEMPPPAAYRGGASGLWASPTGALRVERP
ncbi:MAG: hypothetical protein SFW09_19965 [Hyphomicrobiaceae bacterium]|nr:hypothetical protein [Hyphomicrobiaceae bacterium]